MLKILASGALVGALLAVSTQEARAQVEEHHAAGYVVNARGDTLRGWLDVPRFATEHGIHFSATEGGPAQKLTTQQVRAFGLQDGRQLVRRAIPNGAGANGQAPDSATVFVQQVVMGAASLYRYDFGPANPGLRLVEPGETVLFFVSTSGRTLVPLRRASYPAVLGALLKDCPAVANEARTVRFAEAALADLCLRYNTQCHAGTPSRDQRARPDPANPSRLRLSLRAGAQRSLVYLSESEEFERSHTVAGTSPLLSAELRWGRLRSAWSLALGLQYATQKSTTTHTAAAYAGTTNAGEILDIGSSLRLHSLQLPYVVYYAFGRGPVQPYLGVGASLGVNWGAEFASRALAFTPVAPYSFRQDVATTTTKSEGLQLSYGGLARAGVRLPRVAGVGPLLELHYAYGQHHQQRPVLGAGNPTSQTWGLSLGLEFH
ncbi:PorT family protein [Hymenobacter sp. DH14]|uniref:PorT family protein n=1 Tax=Hymenobacter cyanobacteriorum TaxID=2926463 RepID=A0A9X1VID7_9BACT|nr:outer membrane beta-barrel protein [Hymenobacter cyanobacteriorum]MCI1189402.1 PorT family protein [Hymenobacter cyanobacteriorum]